MINMGKFVNYYIEREFLSRRRLSGKMDSLYMFSGIIISVAALMTAFALFTGYENALKNVILGVNSHCYIFRFGNTDITGADLNEIKDFFKDRPEIEALDAAISAQAMAVHGKKTKGITLRGIDSANENLPTEYHRYVKEGRSRLENDREAVIGVKLMRELGLSIGDTLKVISPLHSRITPMGLKQKTARFRIAGVYESGMYEYDSAYLIMNLEAAAQFTLNPQEFSWVEVKLGDAFIDDADILASRWEDELNEHMRAEMSEYPGSFRIVSWVFYNGNLFTLITLEKWILFIIMSFMVLIASFNVVSGILTSILERKRDIGILKAYGATSGMIKRIFLGRALFMSAVAVLIGEVLGYLLGQLLYHQTIYRLKGDVYFLEKLNVSYSVEVWAMVFAVAMLIVLVTALFPLRKIESMNVTEILRNSPGK